MIEGSHNGRLTADELLAAHAAGRLPPAMALAVATQLALSPASRRRYACYEAAGGVLLDRIEPAPLAPGAWERLAARLDDADRAGPAPPRARVGYAALPRPLRDHLPPAGLGGLAWRTFGGTDVADLDLGLPNGGHRASLIRVRAGTTFPRHSHEGLELALVLEGGFSDHRGHFGLGDMSIADDTIEHEPLADPGRDWLWLRVLDGGLRLSGSAGPLAGI